MAKFLALIGGVRAILAFALIVAAFFVGRYTISCEEAATGQAMERAGTMEEVLTERARQGLVTEREFVAAERYLEKAKGENENCRAALRRRLDNCVIDYVNR